MNQTNCFQGKHELIYCFLLRHGHAGNSTYAYPDRPARYRKFGGGGGTGFSHSVGAVAPSERAGRALGCGAVCAQKPSATLYRGGQTLVASIRGGSGDRKSVV